MNTKAQKAYEEFLKTGEYGKDGLCKKETEDMTDEDGNVYVMLFDDGSYIDFTFEKPFVAEEKDLSSYEVLETDFCSAYWNGEKWTANEDYDVELALVDDHNNKLCSVIANIMFSGEGDNAEVTYYHVMTGSICAELSQVFQGWSERDKEDNLHWSQLYKAISEDDLLVQRMIDCMDLDDKDKIITYSADDVPEDIDNDCD